MSSSSTTKPTEHAKKRKNGNELENTKRAKVAKVVKPAKTVDAVRKLLPKIEVNWMTLSSSKIVGEFANMVMTGNDMLELLIIRLVSIIDEQHDEANILISFNEDRLKAAFIMFYDVFSQIKRLSILFHHDDTWFSRSVVFLIDLFVVHVIGGLCMCAKQFVCDGITELITLLDDASDVVRNCFSTCVSWQHYIVKSKDFRVLSRLDSERFFERITLGEDLKQRPHFGTPEA